MRERSLGTSALAVPVIGQGTAGYDEREPGAAEACARALRLGVDLGMRFIDTAPVYGGGDAEQTIGRALAGVRRQVVLATKFGPEASAPRALVASVDTSLRRLRTDVIDLLQMHWPSYEVPLVDTLEAMARLVESGKVRFLGLGNCTPAEVRRALATPAGRHVVSVQQEYSVAERTVEAGLLDLCRERGLSLIAYTPLGGDRPVALAPGMAALREIAAAHAVTVPQVMLAWLVHDRQILAIPKAGRELHVRENAAAGDLILTDAEHARIAAAFHVETRRLPPDEVVVASEQGRAVYTTLAEARANRLGIVPGPVELAATMRDGELLKPIKVRAVRDGGATRFQLIDGRTRYWAWVIAHGNTPIPAIVTGGKTEREPREFTSRGDAHREAEPSGGRTEWEIS